MARIRGLAQVLFAAALVAVVPQLAHAGITVTYDVIPLPATGSNNLALIADGWVGAAITAHADAASQGIVGFDFSNPNGPLTNPGIFIGPPNGFINRQSGVATFDEDGNPTGFSGSFNPSPVGPGTAPGYPHSGNNPDSFWVNFPAILGADWISISPFVELANMNAATPIADPVNNSVNWGIVTEMHGAGEIASPVKPTDLVIAYVISKPFTDLGGGISGNFRLAGTFTTVSGPPIYIDTAIPEPATLGVLAFGGLFLLARRSRV